MKRRGTPLASLLLVATTSCLAGWVWTMDYEFEPAVERRGPDGSRALPASSEGRQADLVARDETASFTFDVAPGRIELTVGGEGTTPFRLLLERAIFVHVDGRESALYSANLERWSEPTVDTVEHGSKVGLFLWPEEWIRDEPGGPDPTVRADSPIDGGLFVETERATAEARARTHLGRTISILLPIEMDGEERTYRFDFKVVRLAPKRISWA